MGTPKAVCAGCCTGIRSSPMSTGATAFMREDWCDERQRLIDEEFETTVLSWTDQQRRRRRILNGLHHLAEKLSSDGTQAAASRSRTSGES